MPTFLPRAALLAAAAFAVTAPALIEASAAAQGRGSVNGNNVTYVRVNDGGYFEEVSPGKWQQHEPNGRVWARLDEVRRDANTVLLNDRNRRVEVVIDVRAREIRGTEPGGRSWRRYYTIVEAEAERGRGRGRDNDRWDRRDDTRDIEVGPIWNQRDAETKCRDKAREMRGEWTGQWRTTVQGRMSVCEIRFDSGGRWDRDDNRGGRTSTRDIEVGPIWNQNDADRKCRDKAREMRGEWTGQWRTTEPGRMSVCSIRFR